MSYIVKISDTGRFDGEYDGGKTIAQARRKGREFLTYIPAHGSVKICTADREGRLRVKEYVRGPSLGNANRAGSKKRPLSRAKKNVAARRRRKERQYAVPLAGSKTGGVGIATFQSRRQAVKYAEEIGVNPRSIRKNY